MKVEMSDLNAQYLSIKGEIDRAIGKVLENSEFILGPEVKHFEDQFSRLHESKYCVGVNSGTSALHSTLMALDISPGDEVIVPVNTFFATPLAVMLVGAKPVYVDCELTYFNMDVERIWNAITKKTKAIIAVHLYGQPAQMDRIKEIADKYNLTLIEDCAQAHLAEFNDELVGSFGVCGCFSFYPGKNLGAYGEAGSVTTNSEILNHKLRVIRNLGMTQRYHHDLVGHNFRMSGMQGAILNVKMKHLVQWTDIRRKNADFYRSYLHQCPKIILPTEMPNSKHVYHLFVIQAEFRDDLRDFLSRNEIETGLHYPIPCHLQNASKMLGYKPGDFPMAENLAKNILSLPMSEQLKRDDIKYVSDKIVEFYNSC
jgi:dTDP-4-amino-4,6-dideoxygalactose transaminase